MRLLRCRALNVERISRTQQFYTFRADVSGGEFETPAATRRFRDDSSLEDRFPPTSSDDCDASGLASPSSLQTLLRERQEDLAFFDERIEKGLRREARTRQFEFVAD